MFAVAQAIVRKGHNVHWLTSPSHAKRTAQVPVDVRPEFHATKHIYSIDQPLEKKGETGLLDGDYSRLQGRLLAQVEDYRRVLREIGDIDVLVVDVMPYGAQAMYELGEIPRWVSLGVIPMYTSGMDAPLAVSGQAPPTSYLGHCVNALQQWTQQNLTLPYSLAPVANTQRRQLGLADLPRGQPLESYWYSPFLHIQASSSALEFDQRPANKTRVEFVGPLFAQGSVENANHVPLAWDEIVAHPRVIGITQGTFTMNPTSLIIPAIKALSEDKQNLLVVVSPYEREIREQIDVPSNVLIKEWLPYDFLLPQIRLFVTNGGYGSITQALYHKVPLLCAGQTEDKKDTAARVAWAGAGIDLKTDSPSVQQVKQAAEAILGDERYIARAAKMGEELKALGGANEAARLIEEFAKQE
ncbi:uncharacterized protein J7T54_001091 [Emericellopsis cladophorae]|uniref:Erythromycin biosynthesis protein CIII-like C-terminal domain-containing protein n=1 Tax=Emericellopsis cladophorae TaxID=2686198 RepID=A0A9P9Y0B2_9HYPO|nr:uncharacterized protein J7T54_001091 [Emericellopsis cladophorae]KAI6780783.1 hypothetical protein J7T54_001091 [Emericellopsis cladophorae]